MSCVVSPLSEALLQPCTVGPWLFSSLAGKLVSSSEEKEVMIVINE